MNQRRMKKLLASTLVLSLMIGGGTSAFAKDGRNDDHDDDREDFKIDTKWNNAKRPGELKIDFKDLRGKEFEWALRYIVEMAGRGVFEGYEDGSFKPQQTVTRIEAIAAAVRVMGLRDQAESAAEMQTQLNFKDARAVPAWAVGYVAVALENDLFSEYDTNVNPNQPADRLWATTLLVKALKLQNEAEAKMNAKLPFADAAQIPAGSVGYVKVAVEKGLINGFEDNTFRPNIPVTRAQIAALLNRAGDQLPGSTNGVITGTVIAQVANNVLKISSNGQTMNLTLASNAFIYRNGTPVSASALQIGDIVKTRAYNNNVFFVEVTQTGGGTTPAPVPTPANGVITGTVAASIRGNVITLTNGGQTIALPLNGNALFFRSGTQISASGLQVGDIVSTRSYNNTAVFVEVTLPAGSTSPQPSYDRVLSGTITAQTSNNILTVTSGGQTQALSVNGGAFVYRAGLLTNVSALQLGDVVTAYAYNNSAAIIEVTQTVVVQPANTSGDITGTVVAPVANNVLTITSGNRSVRLNVNANAFVYRNGFQTGSAALQAGDVLTAHYYNGVVLYAEVSQFAGGVPSPLPTITQQSGTVVSAESNGLTLISGNQTVTLTLNPNAFVYRGGVQVSAAQLQAGDIITTRSYNNVVIYGQVTQLSNGSNQSFTVSGTYNDVTHNSEGKISTISINQTAANGSAQTRVYNVSSSVTFIGNMDNLVRNHAVVLQGNGQLVNKVYIQ